MTSPSRVRPASRPHVALAAEPGRLPRLLPAYRGSGPVSLADHLDRYGPPAPPVRSSRMRDELIGEVELAGLAGRGGAGFPTARKLAAVAARRNAVVIGNGTEGEPVSAKDKVLMAQSPHLVLDGAVAAASLVGATDAIIVAHPAVADFVAAAVSERRRARTDKVRLSVVPAANTFVAGRSQCRRALAGTKGGQTEGDPAAAVRARAAWAADSGPERGDARATRPHHAVRSCMVSCRRHAERARIDARHARRGGPPSRRI